MLLEAEQYERLERAARRHGRTVSEEIRTIIESGLPEGNPNQGLLDLAAAVERDTPAATRPEGAPAVDDPEFKAWLRGSMADQLQREKLEARTDR